MMANFALIKTFFSRLWISLARSLIKMA